MPVALPPGRAMLCNQAQFHRIVRNAEHDRYGRGRGFAASDGGVLPGVAITAYATLHETLRSAQARGSYWPSSQ